MELRWHDNKWPYIDFSPAVVWLLVDDFDLLCDHFLVCCSESADCVCFLISIHCLVQDPCHFTDEVKALFHLVSGPLDLCDLFFFFQFTFLGQVWTTTVTHGNVWPFSYHCFIGWAHTDTQQSYALLRSDQWTDQSSFLFTPLSFSTCINLIWKWMIFTTAD